MPPEDPEDILSGSLQSLYNYEPITLTSAGALFTYTPPDGKPITLRTPDTQPSNWALHASSIWASSLFLAGHLSNLKLPSTPIRLLELGAGAGLPGITIAQTHPHIEVVISDYPDEELISVLADNVARNALHGNVRAVAYGWGSDTAKLCGTFDIVMAADTLWNPDLHSLFIDTLRATLKPSPASEIHLVVGLHTGRYTIEAFFKVVAIAGFAIKQAIEMELNGCKARNWSVSRAKDEDEKERRRWVVWIVLKWA